MTSILGYSEREFRNLLLSKTVTSICDFYNISGLEREKLIGDPNGNTFINHFQGKMDSLPNLSDFRDELQIGCALGFSELKELASFITKFLAGKERNELSEDQLLDLVRWIDKTTFSKLTNFEREASLHKLAKEARKEQTSNNKQEEAMQNNQQSDSKENDLFKEMNDQINSKLPITTRIQSNLKNENKLNIETLRFFNKVANQMDVSNDFRLSIREHFDQTVKILICDLFRLADFQRQQIMIDITGDVLFNFLFNRGLVESIQNIQTFRDILFDILKKTDNYYSQLKGLYQWIEQWILNNNNKQEEANRKNQKWDSKEKIDLFKEMNDQINSKLPITSIQSNLNNENKLYFSFPLQMKSGKELGADGCIVYVVKDQIIFAFHKEGYFWHRSQFPSSPEIQKQLNQILNQIITLEIDVWWTRTTIESEIICQIISLFPKATTLQLSNHWEKLNLSELPINHKLEMLEISCSHIEGKLTQPPMQLTFTSENNSIKSPTLDWISNVPNLEIYYLKLLKFTSHFNSISTNVSIFHITSVKDLEMLNLSAMSRLVELDIGSIELVQTTLKLPKSVLKLKLGFVDNGTDLSNQINNFSFVPNVNLKIVLNDDNLEIENWWIKKSKFLSCFLSLRISSSAVASSFLKNLDMLIPILESPSMLLTKLDLSQIVLETFPKSIFKLKSLHNLNLTKTNISSIPAEISKLKNLEILEAGFNNLTSKSFPKELSELINLQQLDLHYNKLSSIPDVIISLINLSRLNLSNNQIETISEEISQLKNLTFLNISGNKIKCLPSSFYSLSNLNHLDLSANQLKSLPSSFYSLSNLEYLNLNINQLKSLPPSFYFLKKMEHLDLSNNELTEFGSENWSPPLLRLYISSNKIKELPRANLLNVLRLRAKGNPLRYPPKELIDEDIGFIIDSVDSFDFDSRHSIYKFLEEAPIEIVSKKLIFWGEERAGKTTLMNSLVEGRLLSEKEHEKISKTIGFQVSKLPAQNGNFNVNMWDFAGEMWAIPFHQFFLTPNALYLIVFDLSKSWNQLVKEASDRLNVIVSRSLERVEVLLVGTHAGSKSIEYPGKLMKGLHTSLRKDFNENQVSFLKVKEEFGVFLELVDLQNPLSSNFIEFRKWLYEYLLDGKFKTSPIYHQFLQKIEDPSFRQIISLKRFLNESGLNLFSQQILDLYLDLFHRQGHIACFPKADSILLDSRWLSLDFSELRKNKLEDPEFPKSLFLPQSTIENLLGDTVLEAIRFFKLFNLCFESNENNSIESKFNPKKEKASHKLIFPSLWPESPNAQDLSFLEPPNVDSDWCIYSIMIKFPKRSPPLGLFHRVIVSFLDKLDLKNLIAWEFGIIQIIDDDCAIGFHDRKEQGWLIRMYLQKERFAKAISDTDSDENDFRLLITILNHSLFEVKKCEIQFETKFSCTCSRCREMKERDLNWNQIATSQTFWEKVENHPSANSKRSWLGAEIRCPNFGKATAQWQKLCPSVLKPVLEDHKNSKNEMNEASQKEWEIEEMSIEISKQQASTKSLLKKRKDALETEHTETKTISEPPAKKKRIIPLQE